MDNSASNEKKLLSLLSEGNEAAFEELYHRYSLRLLGFLFKIVKSEINAGEIVQETFIKVWNNREKIDPDKAFQAYLFQIAKNNLYDFFRKVSRDKKLEAAIIKTFADHYYHVEESLSNKEDVELLQRVMDILPPKRREVFKLVKIEERSYVEVSQILHVSVSTVNDHIVKATKFIKDNLTSFPLRIIFISILFSYL